MTPFRVSQAVAIYAACVAFGAVVIVGGVAAVVVLAHAFRALLDLVR